MVVVDIAGNRPVGNAARVVDRIPVIWRSA
jgi:hypothetical protein